MAVFLFFGTVSSPVYSHNPTELDAKNVKKILVVGDSLSAAYKLASDQGWVHLLQHRLLENDYPFTVVNASISGATTAAGLQIMPKALKQHRPEIVLIELGGNDGLQGKPVPYITKNLESLIVMAKNAPAKVLLLGVRLPPNFGARYTGPFFSQYASLAERHDLALVPFFLKNVAGYPDLMMQDGIHPRAEGQPILLENVWEVLKAIVEHHANDGAHIGS